MSKHAHLPKYGKNRIRLSIGERLFDFLNVALFLLIAAAIIFPFFNIFAISLTRVHARAVHHLPQGADA